MDWRKQDRKAKQGWLQEKSWPMPRSCEIWGQLRVCITSRQESWASTQSLPPAAVDWCKGERHTFQALLAPCFCNARGPAAWGVLRRKVAVLSTRSKVHRDWELGAQSTKEGTWSVHQVSIDRTAKWKHLSLSPLFVHMLSPPAAFLPIFPGVSGLLSRCPHPGLLSNCASQTPLQMPLFSPHPLEVLCKQGSANQGRKDRLEFIHSTASFVSKTFC
jgi:hypothetical protein